MHLNGDGMVDFVARQGEPTKPTAKIVDETVARDLLRDKDSVGGLDSLQLFVAGQGGNGTRFRCEYSLDVAVKHVDMRTS